MAGAAVRPVAAAILIATPLAVAAAEPPTVLVLGDSLVAGYGLGPSEGFVPQLQAALDAAGVAAQLINGGVSGDTTGNALDRLDWALADAPDAVIVELGANDMLRGLPVATVEANLNAILDRLGQLQVPVLIAGMRANPSLGADYTEAFDALYPALAAHYGAALFPFFLDGVALDAQLNQADGMHPNPRGVAHIVTAITPAVTALVRQASAG